LKILILKPSSLGDIVQALPVLRLLKCHLPDSEIYWWADSALAPLLEGDPDLAGVVRFERKRWGHIRNWPEMFRSVRWMRGQHFDWVIDLQCLARSGAFAWLANGNVLIGLDEVREGARGFYDVAVRRNSYYTHAADWYLAVLPRLGVPVHNKFVWLPERPQIAADIKSKWPAACDAHVRWVAIQPGARWTNKRWPSANFAEVIRMLAAGHADTRFVILGNGEDVPLGEIVARAGPERCLNLCHRTSLPEMVEWLRLCSMMITNDTGPMHVAAALGKPVIAMFGPTEPRRTGPYGQLENVLRVELPCSPCMKEYCSYEKPNECLNAITPAMVFQRAKNLLERHA
jgi:lipopolysaccharide heptosyltransferase II